MNMSHLRRNCIAAAIALFLLSVAGFGVASAQAPDGHSARDSADWTGYYHGTVPAASSPGIEVWLNLDEFEGKVRYDLVETYLEEKDGTVRSTGTAKWRDGSALQLVGKDENRVLFVAEGWVQFLGADETTGDEKSDYVLRRMDAFAGDGQQLLVDPTQVRVCVQNGRRIIAFPGLINFEHRTEGGHTSLAGDFVIDVEKKEYEMPSVRYYHDRFATGKLMHSAEENEGDWLPFSGDEDVLAQALEAYRGE